MIDHDVIGGLKWILDGDRFGFGMGWTEDSEPRDDHERAGYYIQRAIDLLKEQETELCDRCGRRRMKSSKESR